MIDSLINKSKFRIVVDAIRPTSSLHLLPFSISTLGNNRNEVSTAACGCVILENPISAATGSSKDYSARY